MQKMAELDREVPFAVSINPSSIYEGQQASIEVRLMKDYNEAKTVTWKIKQADGSLALGTDFVDITGAVALAGTSANTFQVTSKPGSVASGSKSFKLSLSSGEFSAEFDLIVRDSGSSSTVAITSTDNAGYINLANRANYTVSGVCSTVAGSVTLVADVSGDEISNSVNCAANLTWSIPLNFSSVVSDGTVNLTVTHVGGAGSIAATTLQIQKDTQNPSVAVTAPAAMSAINATTASGFNLSGTCSEFVRIVTVNFSSSGGGTPVMASALCLNILGSGAWNTTANLSSLLDGTITASVSHSDAAGNSQSASRAFTKDNLIPTVSITAPTALTMFNLANYNAVSISGACDKNGASVTASGPLSGTLTTTCNGTNYTLSGLTLTGADGVKSLTVTILDTAGNSSQASVNVQLDSSVPTATLTGTPNANSNATALNVTVGGSNVAQYVYKVGNLATTDCANAAGYSAAVAIATKITDALGADGDKKLCVRGINANNNTQTLASATSFTWNKDVVAPTLAISTPIAGYYVNSLNKTGFAVTGTCSENGTANVNIAGSAAANVDCAIGNWTANLDFSAASDGPVFILVSQTDSAGNLTQVSRLFTKEVVVPTISFTAPAVGAYINNANKAAFTVSGNCSDYSATPNIAITGGSSTVSVACNGTTWTADIPFGNGVDTQTLTATITDAAGNPADTSRLFNRDTQDPTVTIASPAAGSYVNNANKAAYAVSGTCSDDGTGNVAITGSATATADCASGAWSKNLNFTAATDGAVSITVTHTDPAGNTKQATIGFVKDIVAPTVTLTTPLAGACMNNTTSSSQTITGTCINGDGTVRVSSSDMAAPGYVDTTCSSSAFSVTANLSTVNGQADGYQPTVTVTQTDAAGNPGTASRQFKKWNGALTLAHGGWNDVYAVGAKTYADATASEPGVVRINWFAMPASNTCQPDSFRIYRASSSGGAYSQVSADIPPNTLTYTDTTLVAADFGKGWYYKLRPVIMGTEQQFADNNFTELRVVAPPDNMALMHRWVANQEVCGLMGRTPDSSNNYRCAYSGWGQTSGNYDMGYDMLVDRNELGCNYTKNCGPGTNQACAGTVFSNISNPQASALNAPDDAVFYDNVSLGKCWVKVSGTWRESNDSNAAMTSVVRGTMTSAKSHLPPLVYLNQTLSNSSCAANAVTLSQVTGFTTANKRLLRQKEWRAGAAWAPNLDYVAAGQSSLDNYIKALESGSNTSGYCSADNGHSGLAANHLASGGLDFDLPFFVFQTGSNVATIKCQSRYGLQDMAGNVWEWTSDQLGSCTALGNGCVGVTSSVDAGNSDMLNFRFDGVNEGPGGGAVTDWYIQNSSFSATYFSLPLGLPMLNSDSGNAVTIASLGATKLHDDYFYFSPGNGNATRGLFVGGSWSYGSYVGRWFSAWNGAPSITNNNIGVRCGVPLP